MEADKNLIQALQKARRPLFIWGAGMRAYADKALGLARSLGIPVATTWGAVDLINHDDALMAGSFGTHGSRAANFAVQRADVVISLGARMDTKSTGDAKQFVRSGLVAMVDIDPAEIAKFSSLGRPIDFPICQDAGEFLDSLPTEIEHDEGAWMSWRTRIRGWRRDYDEPKVTWPGVNPYQLMKEIGTWTTKDDILVSDTGLGLGWIMQAFPFKGERFLHAFNMTPMGYGLPAAIGAMFASESLHRRVILITGDGSLMMSLSELATIARHKLNIKIILLNNRGHGMCRQTQRQWLGGSYPATSIDGGLGFPSWWLIPNAFNIKWHPDLKSLFFTQGPGWLEVEIHEDAQLIPQTRFGSPIEDMEPLLSREELCSVLAN